MRALALLLACGTLQPPAERPNIVLIISDDQRWDALGAAGNRAVQTPVLDRMAKEGVYFRQATTHASVCGPSRATLLTGLPTFRHGWLSNQIQNPGSNAPDGFKGLPTLPGLLQEAGYRTTLVGKWHITPDPWRCGFSEVRSWFLGAGGPYRNPKLARGNSRKTDTVRGHINEIFADDAIESVKNAGAKPFFLWLAFTAPHGPYHPNPPRIARLYEGKGVADLVPPGFPADIPVNDWRHYNEAVSHLDEQVGRVLAALRDATLAERTVVAFVSDNGYMMGSRGIGAEGNDGKFVPYEESIRVPLLLLAPGTPRAKGPSDVPVSTLDLPPTLLSLAGVTPPKEWPGRDFSPVLRGEKAPGLEETVSVWAANHGSSYNDAYRAVRTATHKLIAWEKPDRPDELYDLAADPRETRNLIDQAPAVRDDLRRRLRAWMDRTADPALGWKK